MRRSLTLPQHLELSLLEQLEKLNVQASSPVKMAKDILKMSDFYIANPDKETPWSESWAQKAQLTYFFPLNFLRNSMVIAEAIKQNFFLSEDVLIEFGSGLAPSTQAMLNQNIIPKQIHWIERSQTAIKMAKELCLKYPKAPRISHELPSSFRNTVGVFSYSLTELNDLPDWAYQCDKLMVLEPSTQEDGRKLLLLRKKLIAAGYTILAPCTHQGPCPLLESSKTDWCHDRVAIEMPQWWRNVEAELPIKNATITWSYLLAIRSPQPSAKTHLARAVGDPLPDKGKSRLLVCRSSRREFLTMLSRHGKFPEIDRGDSLEILNAEEKGDSELRISSQDEVKVHPRPYAW